MKDSIEIEEREKNFDLDSDYKEEKCDVCGGEGYVTEGEFDDLRDVNCFKCNPKGEIDPDDARDDRDL